MNYAILAGTLSVDPRLTFCAGIRDISGKQLLMCKTRIVVKRYSGESENGYEINDNFSVTAFGKNAEYLASHFQKDSWLILFGGFRNYDYVDVNRTRHYTDYFLVNHIESGHINLSNNLKGLEGKTSMEQSVDDDYIKSIMSKGISLISEREFE
jgi:single-stranded DNA-binding protein